MTPLAPHVTAFFQQRLPLERGASLHTTDSYAYAFKLLLAFASERLKVAPSHLALEQIDAPLVVDFLNHLESQRANRPSSRNVRLAAIKSFMHFLEYRVPSVLEQIQRVLAVPAKKAETRLVKHLTAKEVQAILSAPEPTTRDGIRDRAMLHLCFAAGLRVSELVGLQLADVTLSPHASVLVHGKGRRERCLPLWKTTTVALRAWLAVRGRIQAPELFLNARGEPMSRAGFEYILDKHAQAAIKSCR
jgi:integrase/recombinase XerD